MLNDMYTIVSMLRIGGILEIAFLIYSAPFSILICGLIFISFDHASPNTANLKCSKIASWALGTDRKKIIKLGFSCGF